MTHVEELGGHISMHFTPYNGISWSYDDIFSQVGTNPDIKLFHATQYDCPYKTRESIETKAALMKQWEREARVFGHYSEQRGKPYYDRDKLNRWIRSFKPVGIKVGFQPTEPWNEPEDLPYIDIDMTENSPDTPLTIATWTVIEEPQEGVPYYLVADTAEGMDVPTADETGDFNGAFIFRPPGKDELYPIVCAFIKTQIKAMAFARECMYACVYYNNALLCPEAKGDSSGSFLAECTGWPYLLRMVVVNDQTRKETTKDGFITNAKNRIELFDLVGDMIDSHEENPGMNSDTLLRQAAQCIHGKRGRPDHPPRAHDDLLVPFGIGLWIWKNARNQIQYNGDTAPPEPKRTRHPRGWLDSGGETRPILGSKRGLDSRNRPAKQGALTGRFV